jgi:dephospho-CoA kinase
MSVIALTGNLASGKTTVLRLLKQKGALIFDADNTIHGYYRDRNNSVYKKIAVLFPQAATRRIICRKKLASIVFSDSSQLNKLESIVHPVIIKELLSWVKDCKNKRGIYIAEVPLLFEKNLERYFDRVILVTAKRKVLIQRIIKKYKFSQIQTLKRLSLYMPIKEKIKRSDFIIDNSFDLRKVKKEVDLLWKKLRQNQRVKK